MAAAWVREACASGIRSAYACVAIAAVCSCGSTAPEASAYAAELTGARVKPTPTGSAATGSATARDSAGGLSYEVAASGLAGAITVVHLHLGAPDENGPVIAGLPVRAAAGTIAAGRIDLSGYVTYNTLTIAGDSVRARLRAGNVYVDVHTVAFPGGELRGSLLPR